MHRWPAPGCRNISSSAASPTAIQWRYQSSCCAAVTFSTFFFYKTRIVPEHFWAARRFLAITLPGALFIAFVADYLAHVDGVPRHRRDA